VNDDFDLEARLRHYHPAGPSLDLRDRVLGPVRGGGAGIWWELAAAAVLLAIGLGVNQLSGRITRRITADLEPVRAPDERLLDALADTLGGGAEARVSAEAWMDLETREETP
jgi:hypothetical protein